MAFEVVSSWRDSWEPIPKYRSTKETSLPGIQLSKAPDKGKRPKVVSNNDGAPGLYHSCIECDGVGTTLLITADNWLL
jgi:hypothetical protein